MSEMIERVARALFAIQHSRSEDSKAFEQVRSYYENQARAAIQAMREPTKAMRVAAAHTACTGDEGGTERADFMTEYEAAIYQALDDRS